MKTKIDLSNLNPDSNTVMKQIKKYIITTSETNLKKNFYESYADLLTDSLGDDMEYFEMDVNRLSDCIQQIDKYGFTPLFKDGYTMMLLSSNDFRDVEDFFREHSNDDAELEIHIQGSNTIREIVKHNDLSY
jgi:hypothetical protein